jgi:hypothetical protein
MYHLLRDSIWLTVRWFKSSAKYDHAMLAENCCRLFLHGFVTPGVGAEVLAHVGRERPHALSPH